jgi:hypothetical protein
MTSLENKKPMPRLNQILLGLAGICFAGLILFGLVGTLVQYLQGR